MPKQITLLDLGTAIADVLAFLGPADQHKLRRTSAAMCEWFDSAAENGSLAFFVTFAPASAAAAAPLRWRHATASPRGLGPRQKTVPATSPAVTAKLIIPPATVTVHLRNYYLSSFNAQAGSEADDATIEKAVIRLVDNFAFEHKLVLTGLFGIRSIGDCFCREVKAVEVEFRGEGSELRSVGRGWMSDCTKLRSVSFSGFGSLEEVGGNWMCGCSHLESITFADDMPNLTKVCDRWMSRCSNLRHVDLTGLTALEEVGCRWIYDCFCLESIAFADHMPRLKKVGCDWMYNCASLKHVDLSGFTALEEVGDCWMATCSSLESIAFAVDMPKLKKIGSSWMYLCSRLKHVDLTGFAALEEVRDYWLSKCSSLESIAFDMPKLKKVGWSWLHECSSLKHVCLTGFAALEEVGDYWLYGCAILESITFASHMPNLKVVGSSWLTACPKLTHLNFECLTALENVGDRLLSDHLKTLKLYI